MCPQSVCLCVDLQVCIFLSLECLSVSVSLEYVCLFGCYPSRLIICATQLYSYYQLLFCDITIIFINHNLLFLILSFHPLIGGEFKTLSSSSIAYPCPSVVLLSFFFFCFLQRVIFCFWLFFELSFFELPTTGADTCFSLSVDIK